MLFHNHIVLINVLVTMYVHLGGVKYVMMYSPLPIIVQAQGKGSIT